MKIIVLAFLCLCVNDVQAGGFTSQVTGAWRGVGVQDGTENWLIKLDMRTNDARAAYPEFPCTATWVFGLELGRSLSAVEQLTSGQDLCANDSILVIESPSDDQLIVSWTAPNGVQIGFAVLHRDDPALNNRANEAAATNLTRMRRNLGLRGNPAYLPPTS